MNVLEITDAVNDRVYSSVKTGQDRFLQSVQSLQERRSSLLSERQTIEFPKPGELVDRLFGYAGALLEAQRQFVAKLFELGRNEVKGAASSKVAKAA